MTALFVQFSDCGQHIRRWAREPFEGGKAYVAADLKFAVTDAMEKAGVHHALHDSVHGSNGGWAGYVRRLWGAMNMARLSTEPAVNTPAGTGNPPVGEEDLS